MCHRLHSTTQHETARHSSSRKTPKAAVSVLLYWSSAGLTVPDLGVLLHLSSSGKMFADFTRVQMLAGPTWPGFGLTTPELGVQVQSSMTLETFWAADEVLHISVPLE
jgi:hypothetical protein